MDISTFHLHKHHWAIGHLCPSYFSLFTFWEKREENKEGTKHTTMTRQGKKEAVSMSEYTENKMCTNKEGNRVNKYERVKWQVG